jgi:hypothetical protein
MRARRRSFLLLGAIALILLAGAVLLIPVGRPGPLRVLWRVPLGMANTQVATDAAG